MVPADLLLVLAVAGLTNLLVFEPTVVFERAVLSGPTVLFDSTVDQPLLRAVSGMLFVLFVPGYALISALFPESGRPLRTAHAVSTENPRAEASERGNARGNRLFAGDPERDRRRIDGIERAALSFGLSIALVPLLMVGLSISPYAITLAHTFLVIDAVVVVCVGIAFIRRWTVPEAQRFRVPYRAWFATGRAAITGTDSRFDAVLNVALAVAILLAAATLAGAITAPPDGERFTEFYVLSENDGGELIAANYSASLSPEVPEPIYLGIENHEGETIEYTVVVQLQRVEGNETESVVADRAEVDRFSTTVAHNETLIRERGLTLSDDITGEELRLMFLLYDGSVPDTPTRDNAYRSLHLWVDVEAEGP